MSATPRRLPSLSELAAEAHRKAERFGEWSDRVHWRQIGAVLFLGGAAGFGIAVVLGWVR